jgi:hypothetical protein
MLKWIKLVKIMHGNQRNAIQSCMPFSHAQPN